MVFGLENSPSWVAVESRFTLPDGTQHQILVGQEKGVDIRIALDVVNAAITGACDVAIVFSQDQDLSEVADEVRRIPSSYRNKFVPWHTVSVVHSGSFEDDQVVPNREPIREIQRLGLPDGTIRQLLGTTLHHE